MSELPFTMDQTAIITRRLRGKYNFTTTQTERKIFRWVTTGAVLLGIAAASFYITPARAGGSMASDVRIIYVQPHSRARTESLLKGFEKRDERAAKAADRAAREQARIDRQSERDYQARIKERNKARNSKKK